MSPPALLNTRCEGRAFIVTIPYNKTKGGRMSVRRIPALTRAGLGAALLTAGFGLAAFMAPTTASASEAPTISICSSGTMHAAHWKVGK